jgi:EmrB/QacA subfamily drug resistance transporter
MNATRRWWTFAIVSIALFMGMLDNLVVTTALPSIQRALHATVSDLEWTVNAYTLAFAVLMIPAAALGDRFGRRRVLLIGVFLFTAGSAAAALSTSAGALAFARAVQGVGGACITPLTLTMLTAAFPASRRAAVIGLWSGVSGLGLAAGPLVGGAIVEGWTWNAVFWLNVPIGILLLVLGRIQLAESFGEPRPMDLPGIALIGAGLLGIVYGLVRGNTLGWGSTEIVGALAAGTALTLAFLARERLTAHPVVDLRLFSTRGITVPNAVGFLMSFGMFGSIFLITLFVQNVLHYSPLKSGLATMPWTGTIMLVAPFAGILAGRIGSRPVVVTGMALQALALAWIGALASTSTPYTSLLPAFLAGGLGMGLTFAPLSAAVMSMAGKDEGQASAVYNTIRELGGVFGVAILGAVFQHVVVAPADFVIGFRTAVFAGAAVLSAGVALSFLMVRAQPAQAEAAIQAGNTEIIAASAA